MIKSKKINIRQAGKRQKHLKKLQKKLHSVGGSQHPTSWHNDNWHDWINRKKEYTKKILEPFNEERPGLLALWPWLFPSCEEAFVNLLLNNHFRMCFCVFPSTSLLLSNVYYYFIFRQSALINLRLARTFSSTSWIESRPPARPQYSVLRPSFAYKEEKAFSLRSPSFLQPPLELVTSCKVALNLPPYTFSRDLRQCYLSWCQSLNCDLESWVYVYIHGPFSSAIWKNLITSAWSLHKYSVLSLSSESKPSKLKPRMTCMTCGIIGLLYKYLRQVICGVTVRVGAVDSAGWTLNFIDAAGMCFLTFRKIPTLLLLARPVCQFGKEPELEWMSFMLWTL